MKPTFFGPLLITLIAVTVLLACGSQPSLPPTATQPSATVAPTPIPDPETPMPTPRSLDHKIDNLLASMTLEQKVGQLFMVFFQGPVLSPALREMIEHYHIGGIVLFSISGNVESPTQVAGLINAAQAVAVDSGAGIPLFVSVDQEGGSVVRLRDGFTVFPSQMAVGATASTALAAQMAAVTGAEFARAGHQYELGAGAGCE